MIQGPIRCRPMPLVLPSESVELEDHTDDETASQQHKGDSVVAKGKGKRVELARSELFAYQLCLCPSTNKKFQRRHFTLAVETTPMHLPNLTTELTELMIFTLLGWMTMAPNLRKILWMMSPQSSSPENTLLSFRNLWWWR